MKKLNMIIVFLAITLMVIFLCPLKMYKYTEDYIPPVTYEIKVNKVTKVLTGTFYHSCSVVDCDGSTYKCSMKLTNDEYKKIMKLWNDKKALSPILESLCENEKILYQSYKDYKDKFDESVDDYNTMDLNNDGKITSREFANQWLIEVISEQ